MKKKNKSILARILCAVMVFSLAAAHVPGKVAEAVWMPDHQIPAYQQKDIYETERVTISGIKVKEVTNATVSPIQTRDITEAVTFDIFNSTTQKVEQTVQSQNGVLPDLELVKNHNYIFFAKDSTYRMNHMYVWVKDGKLIDIKHYNMPDPDDLSYVPEVKDYPEVDTLQLYRRDSQNPNPADDRRVGTSIKVLSSGGAPLYNVKFKLVSAIETIETSSGENAKIVERLLEDVNYMVVVESNDWDIDSFPVVVKDKSEYRAGKYTYDHSSCAGVNEVKLISKQNAHKNDTVLTNTNYDEVYNGVYENIAGNTTITGLNFKDLLVLDKKLDKSTVQDASLADKDYDVIDIKIVNPHRWEIAELAAGEYEITEKIDGSKRVANVYYKDGAGSLQAIDFKQVGKEVTFTMNSLSLYPVVIEYADAEVGGPVIDRVFAEVTDVSEDGKTATAKVTVEGTAIPETLYARTYYQEEGGDDPDPTPAVDPKTLNVKVVDETGKAVEGVKLCLEYSGWGSTKIAIPSPTDAEGKISSGLSELQNLLPDEEHYVLKPAEDSGYTCAEPKNIIVSEDDDWNSYIESVDNEEYTGEITLVVKKEGGDDPDPTPVVDPKTLNVKVVDETGKAVEGVKLCLEYSGWGSTKIAIPSPTDAEGKISSGLSELQNLLPDEEHYVLKPAEDSGYTCAEPKNIIVSEDDDWNSYIESVDNEEYTGEITLVVKKEGGDEPDPAPVVDPQILNVKVIDEAGKAVEGVKLCLEYSGWGSTKIAIPSPTDADGKVSSCLCKLQYLLADEEPYELAPTSDSGYTCAEPKNIIVSEDDDWNLYIESVDDEAYTGEITLVVQSASTRSQTFTARANDADVTLSDWKAAGEYTAYTAEGTDNKRTFEVTLPLKDYPSALKWAVKVALNQENVNADLGEMSNEMDITLYNDETNQALEDLKQAVKDAEALKEADYTAESWKAFSAAVQAGKELAEKAGASKGEYLAAIQAIQDAQAKLEKKSNVENPDPSKPGVNPGDKDNTNSSGSTGNTTGNTSASANQKTPATGDTANILPAVIGMLAAVAVIIAIVMRRRKFR